MVSKHNEGRLLAIPQYMVFYNVTDKELKELKQ